MSEQPDNEMSQRELGSEPALEAEPAPQVAAAVPEVLPRELGTDTSPFELCPTCGASLSITTSPYGSTSPVACEVCHPATAPAGSE